MISSLGSDTKYYSAGPSTTQWIGINSVVIETHTVTYGASVSTITTSAILAVSTATIASDGVAIGDLNIVLTPAAKSQLESLFAEAQLACPLPGKLKSRSAVESCAVEYLQEHAPEEIVRTFQNGLENLGELIYTYGADALALPIKEKIQLGLFVTVLIWAVWAPNGVMPDAVKLAKTQYETSTATQSLTVTTGIDPVTVPPRKSVFTSDLNQSTGTSRGSSSVTSSSESLKISPPPVLIGYPHVANDDFDTVMAAALASGLEQQFAILYTNAKNFVATAAPLDCQCTQIINIDGSRGELNCDNLGAGADCGVSPHSYYSLCSVS